MTPAWFSKPGHSPPYARLELALQQAVPIIRRSPATVSSGKSPGAGKLRAVPSTIEPAEELVPAAHGEHGRSAAGRLPDRVSPPSEIGRNQPLLTILPTADVEQVVLARTQLVAQAHRLDLEPDSAPAGPARQDGDVASIRIDVQVLG